MSYAYSDVVRRSKRAQWIAIELLRYLLIVIILAFFLFPILWIFSTSFKIPEEYIQSPPVYIPQQPHLNHYIRALGPTGDGAKALRDTFIISTCATFLTVVTGAAAAYSMARFDTGGKNFSFWILSQRMLPPVAVIVPIFLLYRTVKLIDTHAGLIITYSVFFLPFCIWLLRSYFIDLPAEVEESALIDGASRWQVLRLVVLPLAAGGLIATTVFIFIAAWTEFLFALILTRTSVLTLPVLTSRFFGVQSYEWGVASAVSVVSTAPILVLGLMVRRHFVRGITMGAVKS